MDAALPQPAQTRHEGLFSGRAEQREDLSVLFSHLALDPLQRGDVPVRPAPEAAAPQHARANELSAERAILADYVVRVLAIADARDSIVVHRAADRGDREIYPPIVRGADDIRTGTRQQLPRRFVEHHSAAAGDALRQRVAKTRRFLEQRRQRD